MKKDFIVNGPANKKKTNPVTLLPANPIQKVKAVGFLTKPFDIKEMIKIIDTALESPSDYCEPESAPPVLATTYAAQARSAVVLRAR